MLYMQHPFGVQLMMIPALVSIPSAPDTYLNPNNYNAIRRVMS